MKLLNKLERKLGRYAIPNLMKYIVILLIVGLLFGTMPNGLIPYLGLDFDMIKMGQVWRLITFIIPITSGNILLFAISTYVYYIIGNALENTWGAFRFNLYFFSGIIFNIVASFIFYLITGYSLYSLSPTLTIVCGTLFFAFAAVYPNTEFRLYFLIPVKAKYLAWLQGAFYLYNIFTYIASKQYSMVIPLIVGVANFLIFFLATRNYQKISPSEYKRKATYQRQMKAGKSQGNVVQFNGRNVVTRHKCAVCGKTELDNDQLEFRFCSKCDGNYEYCMDHLFTHEHVHKEEGH
ncbi:MAG: hypothetical protein ACYDEX_13650 [Mobilitalea sp.]